MTYSIVARDPVTGELGIGSQSHFFGVGRLVGWGETGVGAVATQAFVNVDYGPQAVAVMKAGGSAQDAVDNVTASDPLSAYRQLGVVDAAGRAVSFTGARCAPAAGGLVGDGVAVQGNMLASTHVCRDMLAAYRSATGSLADRLVAAMAAAEKAGGDIRGSQSAVLTVFGADRSDTPWKHVVVDIRVDDHPDPVGELTRLLPRQRAFDVIGEVIFAADLMIGPYRNVPPEVLRDKLTRLAEAAEVLGDENREAQFWRALLLARSGDRDGARSAFAELFAHRPALREFLTGIAPLGFLDDVTEYL
ncbi:DUF1028 domain-containing protein [Mycolicibacterium komossense]|uniref:DUF1028 domain-containing protein n=1 Tax=Mycolicibacterium komossense TaxID=1779 RepID=A0ABT3CIA4_9MYCO|nr:DUF1028 domain-containing protein [Mycolicibacterium komossense]MCV7229195.1 DUF1028 domain-containing protein [Mycolicibacterium komossense]